MPAKKTTAIDEAQAQEAQRKADIEKARAAADKQIKAFLDMIAYSELGAELIAASDNGYNVLYGGKLFKDYSDHPRIVSTFKIKGNPVSSSAAGRYQILARFWDHYRRQLNLKDFGPASQDAYAKQILMERRAIPDIVAGRIESAIEKCANIWASFPGAGYNQHEQKIGTLIAAFKKAGGVVAA